MLKWVLCANRLSMRVVLVGILVLTTFVAQALLPKKNARFYLNQALAYQKTNTDSCFYFANLAYEKAEKEANQNIVAKSAHLLADVYSTYGLYSKAIDHYNAAKAIYKEQSNDKELGQLLNDLGEVYYYAKNLKLSLDEFEAALKLNKQINDSLGMAEAYTQIGHYYEKEQTYLKALTYQQRAKEIYKSYNDSIGLAKVHLNIGSIYEDQADYELAFIHFQQAYDYNRCGDNRKVQVDILNNLGDIFRKTARFYQANLYMNRALNIAIQLGDQRQIQNSLKDLAKNYADQQVYDSAFFILDTVLDLYKTMYLESNTQQIAGIQTLYDLHEKEYEFDLLKKESELSASRKSLLYITLIALLILVLVIFFSYRFRIKKNQELYLSEQRLIQTKLSNAQEHETELEVKIAAQNKALTTYALQTVQDKKVIKDLAASVEHVKNNIKDSDLEKVLQQSLLDLKSALNQDNYWEDFKMFFEQVHPNFLKQLLLLAPNISSAEKRLCTLLKLNMRSKDIATVMRISPDSVRIARYRLRKKLPIEQGDDLVGFLNNLEKS